MKEVCGRPDISGAMQTTGESGISVADNVCSASLMPPRGLFSSNDGVIESIMREPFVALDARIP